MGDLVQRKKQAGGGLPAWMGTFADLCTLLLCFFVLLLSFAETDAKKFKELAGSMADAFGVQREIKVKEIPKGTSIIMREFSPGRPDPTILDDIRQKTMDDSKKHLVQSEADAESTDSAQELAQQLAELLDKEIKKGDLEIEHLDQQTIIRIVEENSFEAGSAKLQQEFLPVLNKIRKILIKLHGKIRVTGHTDDNPVTKHSGYRSNWDLSAARAVSVVHRLLMNERIARNRFTVEGAAETQPLAINDTPENRKRNRRVEISITQGARPQEFILKNKSKANSPEKLEEEKLKNDFLHLLPSEDDQNKEILFNGLFWPFRTDEDKSQNPEKSLDPVSLPMVPIQEFLGDDKPKSTEENKLETSPPTNSEPQS